MVKPKHTAKRFKADTQREAKSGDGLLPGPDHLGTLGTCLTDGPQVSWTIWWTPRVFCRV